MQSWIRAILLAPTIAACGGDNPAPGGGFANDKLTRTQVVATMAQLASAVAAASTDAQKPENCDGVELELDCDRGGLIRFSCSGERVTISYEQCELENGRTINGSVKGTSTLVEIDSVVVSYPGCGQYVFNGTITVGGNGKSFTFDLTVSSGDEELLVQATLTISDSGTLGGTLTYSGAFAATCNFNDTPDTCPAIAGACSLTADEVCDGEEFRTDVCPFGG
jgi:hypothetical protein